MTQCIILALPQVWNILVRFHDLTRYIQEKFWESDFSFKTIIMC